MVSLAGGMCSVRAVSKQEREFSRQPGHIEKAEEIAQEGKDAFLYVRGIRMKLKHCLQVSEG